MAVFRVEKNSGYTVMSNHHLRNRALSLKAKGLLSQMLSLPEDWDYTLQGLARINRESIDAIRQAIRELEQAGYIQRSRERDEKGRLRGADYVIFELPQPVPASVSPTLENPTLENPTQENPTLENPMQLNQEAVDAAQTEYQEAAAAINGMADAQDSAADSAEDVAAALSDAQNNIQGIISAYNEAYDAALKSVSGQYDLWDTAEKIVATSASSINSALESQITYWDSYNQNLESLNARAADIDGLSAVIASFADGSKDSVNAIAGMAAASDSDLAKMVQNYQELQEAQKTTSESMADLETGIPNPLNVQHPPGAALQLHDFVDLNKIAA